MKPEERDQAHLWDMLQSAIEARDLCKDLTFEAIRADRRTLLALERLMELIGEAARRVSDESKKTHADIAWRNIIGMRNVLAHEYGTIDHRRLFLAATQDTATLIRILEPLVRDRI